MLAAGHGRQRLDRPAQVEHAGDAPVGQRPIAQHDDAGIVAPQLLDDLGQRRAIDDQPALAPGGDVLRVDLRSRDLPGDVLTLRRSPRVSTPAVRPPSSPTSTVPDCTATVTPSPPDRTSKAVPVTVTVTSSATTTNGRSFAGDDLEEGAARQQGDLAARGTVADRNGAAGIEVDDAAVFQRHLAAARRRWSCDRPAAAASATGAK